MSRAGAQEKKLTDEIKFLSKQIRAEENKKKEIEKELEQAELEMELAGNEKKYYDILIKELIEEYGEAGQEILEEIAPEILQELKANHTLP